MPTVLDDKLLSMRLALHPEFLIRLVEFLYSYGVLERPVLVIQARPAHGSALAHINVDDANVQQRFLAGVATNNGWWQGFRSMVAARPTINGIASLPAGDHPKWSSELHRDGHFIAGIWTFPDFPVRGKDVETLADFYVDVFVDFVRLIESTLAGVSEQPSYEATWTLVHAPKLHYASRSMFGQFSVSASPLQIPHLQWSISAAKVGTPEWGQLAVRMSQALTGAYGGVPPSDQ